MIATDGKAERDSTFEMSTAEEKRAGRMQPKYREEYTRGPRKGALEGVLNTVLLGRARQHYE